MAIDVIEIVLDHDIQVPSLISFFQQIVLADPQLEGFSPHELRQHMLLPAATLPGDAGFLRSAWSTGNLCSA